MRPALVVSCDWINTRPLVVLVVPGTKGAQVQRDYPTNVRVAPEDSGLPDETVFLCFQARAVDPSRFPPHPDGQVDDAVMRDISRVLRFCFDI